MNLLTAKVQEPPRTPRCIVHRGEAEATTRNSSIVEQQYVKQ